MAIYGNGNNDGAGDNAMVMQNDCDNNQPLTMTRSNVNCTTMAERGKLKSERKLTSNADWMLGNGQRHHHHRDHSHQKWSNRANVTLEERIRSRFFGYDMPYPPIDFAVNLHLHLHTYILYEFNLN